MQLATASCNTSIYLHKLTQICTHFIPSCWYYAKCNTVYNEITGCMVGVTMHQKYSVFEHIRQWFCRFWILYVANWCWYRKETGWN